MGGATGSDIGEMGNCHAAEIKAPNPKHQKKRHDHQSQPSPHPHLFVGCEVTLASLPPHQRHLLDIDGNLGPGVNGLIVGILKKSPTPSLYCVEVPGAEVWWYNAEALQPSDFRQRRASALNLDTTAVDDDAYTQRGMKRVRSMSTIKAQDSMLEEQSTDRATYEKNLKAACVRLAHAREQDIVARMTCMRTHQLRRIACWNNSSNNYARRVSICVSD